MTALHSNPDLYDTSEPPAALDPLQEKLVLSVCPAGARIAELQSFIPEWERYPLRVRVATADGWERWLALTMQPEPELLEREARLLPVLARLGLPVSEVLAGPVGHAEQPAAGAMMVLRQPPGRPLPFLRVTPEELDRTCEVLLASVARLHTLTGPLEQEAIAAELPRRTLEAEVDEIAARGGPWLEQPVFADAIKRLRPVLEAIDTPLVFSNGNVNTWLIRSDGQEVSGYIRLERACLEDPLVGFAKYRLWELDRGWAPFRHAGLVERFLYRGNWSRADFAPRLALRCLRELQAEVPPQGDEKSPCREWLLELLRESLACVT